MNDTQQSINTAPEMTPAEMREAIAAIMPLVRNGMTQEQIEKMAREQHARVNG